MQHLLPPLMSMPKLLLSPSAVAEAPAGQQVNIDQRQANIAGDPCIENFVQPPAKLRVASAIRKATLFATTTPSTMNSCDEQHHMHGRHDPTLDSCCERDLAQQAQARLHLKRLEAVDPSTARAGMTAAVLGVPMITSNCQEEAWEPLEDSSDNDAGKTSYTLDHVPITADISTVCWCCCRLAPTKRYAAAAAEARDTAALKLAVTGTRHTDRAVTDRVLGTHMQQSTFTLATNPTSRWSLTAEACNNALQSHLQELIESGVTVLCHMFLGGAQVQSHCHCST